MTARPAFLERGHRVSRLDAFVDAAFAFALTLLVIAGDRIPGSIDALMNAIKNIPAFALSFLLILKFWVGHVAWSRHFAIDDAVSRRLTLLLVFLVLVFVYPMRMMFEVLCSALTNGYLPATYAIASLADVPRLFVVFAVAFGSMGATMALLYWHAWRHRYMLALTPAEAIRLRSDLIMWLLIPTISIVSIVLSQILPLRHGLLIGLPGFVYFLLNITAPLLRRQARRKIAALGVEAE